MSDETRPLGHKAYGSIGHLPGSRTGPADRHVPDGAARICTTTARDRADFVLVQEKLDGSCVCAARVGDEILALGRGGGLAAASEFPVRQAWARWVAAQRARFLAVLTDGERLVGEFLALAHSTRYALPHEPFVAFDLMRGWARAPWAAFTTRVAPGGFVTPGVVHAGGPLGVAAAMARLQTSFHGALDPVEGAVWRVERHPRSGPHRVDFLAKYVRPDKRDGALLPEATGAAPIWNWQP